MKVYFGFSSPNERIERACEDWECRRQKKSFYFYRGSCFGFKWSVKRKEA